MSDSSKSIGAFLQKISGDESLQSQINAASSADAILALAAAEGYQFNKADLQAALAAPCEQSQTLSDHDLSQVAGGARFLTTAAQRLKQLFDAD